VSAVGEFLVYDISMPIHHQMPVYKNNEANRPVLKVIRDFDTGSVRESGIEMNLHTGTHLDAPLHMFQTGAAIDALDLRQVVSKCRVLDLTRAPERISAAVLMAEDIQPREFVLLKTLNSARMLFDDCYIYLEKSGAVYLRDRDVTGVGIDALGIERDQPEHETHRALMGAGIVILEGLCLSEVPAGEYILVAAPLKISGGDAAPTRAILLKI